MDEMEQEELLYRLDERTERIEQEHMRRLKEVERDVAKNQAATESNEKRIQRNETHVKYMTGGISTLVGAVIAKLAGLLQFVRI